MRNNLLEHPKQTGTEYRASSHSSLKARAKRAGSALLGFIAPKWGPEAEATALGDYNKHMAEKHLKETRDRYTPIAETYRTYTDATNRVLSGKRPEDTNMQRHITGEYIPRNAQSNADHVQVAVYDQGRLGPTRTNENNKGVSLTRNMKFEDGTNGYRRETYTPGLDQTLRVQTTDYHIGADGKTTEHLHSAGWSQDKLGGAEATVDQAAFIQEVVFAGDTQWDQQAIRPINQQ
jgi:hypothetical protein